MTMSSPSALLAFIVAALAGCDNTLRAEDYDRTCTESSECQPLFLGDLCEFKPGCRCANAAINMDSLLDYQRHIVERECDLLYGEFIRCTCGETLAFCMDGTCDVPRADGGR
jgi:hypothetical protein